MLDFSMLSYLRLIRQIGVGYGLPAELRAKKNPPFGGLVSAYLSSFAMV